MLKKVIIAAASIAFAIAAPVQAGMFGIPAFKIEQSDDRFSADGLTSFSGHYNRISKKSLAGGVHIDAKGVFVEPFAAKSRADNKLVGVSFMIHNETTTDTTMGAPLAFGGLQRITFITGEGTPIVLIIKHAKDTPGEISSYNSLTHTASSSLSETGSADVTPQDYLRIINASALAVKIEGGKRDMIYETKDIAKTFIPNLKTFYDQHIAG